MSRRRAALELALAYSLILAVIWTPDPWQRVFYIAAVVALAAILALSFQGPRALGIRRTSPRHRNRRYRRAPHAARAAPAQPGRRH